MSTGLDFGSSYQTCRSLLCLVLYLYGKYGQNSWIMLDLQARGVFLSAVTVLKYKKGLNDRQNSETLVS